MVNPLYILGLAGDGIGPEITKAALGALIKVMPILSRPLRLKQAEIGFAALDAMGTTIPDAVIAQAKEADGVLLGPVSHNSYPPVAEGGLNPSGVLRKALGLFANQRPAVIWPGVDAPARGPVDLVVMRENLEGFYADRNMHVGPGEFMPDPDTALSLRKITRAGSENIARAGFALAATRAAKSVTVVHKANVMRVSDGLFLEVTRGVAAEYPDIAYREMLVDAAAAHLVRDASQFDVIVTTNMFGDILSDLASELAGGLGLAGSLNFGADHAVAQAQHGSAPDIAGQDTANPTAMILSLEMLLRHLGEGAAADLIQHGVADTLADADSRTVDLGGPQTTAVFAARVIGAIEKAMQ